MSVDSELSVSLTLFFPDLVALETPPTTADLPLRVTWGAFSDLLADVFPLTLGCLVLVVEELTIFSRDRSAICLDVVVEGLTSFSRDCSAMRLEALVGGASFAAVFFFGFGGIPLPVVAMDFGGIRHTGSFAALVLTSDLLSGPKHDFVLFALPFGIVADFLPTIIRSESVFNTFLLDLLPP